MKVHGNGKSYKGGARPSVEVGVETRRYGKSSSSQRVSKRQTIDPKSKG